MRNELMHYNQTSFEVQINKDLNKLEEELRSLKESSLTGLTTDELQGIHGLIQGQIALISSLQTSDDVLKVHSAVTPLAILVSLVSKPTD